MTSLIVDIGMLIGVLAYSAYLITLLIRYRALGPNGGVQLNSGQIFESQTVNRISWAPVTNGKTSLAFQRVARRV